MDIDFENQTEIKPSVLAAEMLLSIGLTLSPSMENLTMLFVLGLWCLSVNRLERAQARREQAEFLWNWGVLCI